MAQLCRGRQAGSPMEEASVDSAVDPAVTSLTRLEKRVNFTPPAALLSWGSEREREPRVLKHPLYEMN